MENQTIFGIFTKKIEKRIKIYITLCTYNNALLLFAFSN